jgi:hypothetical protein
MAKNLNRLTAAANRLAAHHDYNLVWAQLKRFKPPVPFPTDYSARAVDQATRALIAWAQEQKIDIRLPEGWKR